MTSTPPFRIALLTSIDPVLRASACFNLAMDSPRVAILSHDITDDAVRHVVSDAGGVVERETTELDHSCLSCAVREDMVPVLQRLMPSGAWDGAVVALPVSADSTPVARALHAETREGGRLRGAQLAAITCVVNAPSVVDDALGGEALGDLGLALTSDDDRVVGEALSPMLAHADVVIADAWDGADARARALVHHLRGTASTVLTSIAELDADALLGTAHRAGLAAARVDPLVAAAPDHPDADGVWTLVLESERPFHPGRLRDNVHRLAGHPIRTRGHFWVPTRPHSACVWDGAGGQLSIGEHGPWGRRPRGTRIVVTGAGPERDQIARAFKETLLSDAEIRQRWADVPDHLDQWLGMDI